MANNVHWGIFRVTREFDKDRAYTVDILIDNLTLIGAFEGGSDEDRQTILEKYRAEVKRCYGRDDLDAIWSDLGLKLIKIRAGMLPWSIDDVL